MSGDRTYYLWGPGQYTGDCVIVLGARKEKLLAFWNEVNQVTTSAPNEWAMEQLVPVYLCTGKKFASFSEVWPQFKSWR